ncbi:mpv17-like protein 2, partial [Notothenia coriiceps]|uniref:Mpv17-like protein 2 n=1 Tax=Notothenia coriiceps TaxID=8208 RepID=A0A6I9Q5X9_9TELE
MLPRVGKEFVVRMRFNWRPFFEGRTLLLTNTLSGGVILGLGDIAMQSWENFKKPGRVRDWKRTGCMFTVGCSMGPMLHYWYIFLDRAFVGRALKTVGKKVLVDQLVASPFLGMWYFLGEEDFKV